MSPFACSQSQTVEYLFSRANHDLLEMFAWSNVLLAFDYDGTLAPLVTRRRTPPCGRPRGDCSGVRAGSIPAS